MKIKKWLTIIIVIMLFVVTVACGNKTNEESNEANGGSKELNLLTWEGYADDSWIKPFEEKTGIKVTITYVGSVDELFSKAKGGGVDYDIAFPDSGSLARYYEHDLIQPIDESKLSNWDNLSAFFKNNEYKTIDGKLYAVPWAWGVHSMLVNNDMLEQKATSWSDLWDPNQKGKVGIMDDSNNVILMTAIMMGMKDPFNLSDDELNQVKEKIVELLKNTRLLTNGLDSETSSLQNKSISLLHAGFDTMVYKALKDKGNFEIVYPKEGVPMWIDNLVQLKTSKNKVAVYEFLNYCLTPEVAAKLYDSSGYGVAVDGAEKFVNDASSMISATDLMTKTKTFILKKPESYEKRANLWQEVKAGL